MKNIIIYYSRQGRTARLAREWAHRTGASRLEIIPMAYRGTLREYLQYLWCTLTRQEMELDLYNVDFSKYDRTVLMIPVICGMMAAPTVGAVLSDILPYLGVEAAVTEEIILDDLTGLGPEDARAKLNEKKLEALFAGEGGTVVSQIPQAGQQVPEGSRILLYLGQ